MLFPQGLASLPAHVRVEPSVVTSALTAGLAALGTIWYLWRQVREPWLRWLVVCWVFWCVRYAVALLHVEVWPLGDVRSLGLMLARDTALVFALRSLGLRGVLRAWGVVLIPIAVTVVRVALGVPEPWWFGSYLFTEMGVLWMAGAYAIWRSSAATGGERLLAASGFAAHALLVAATPWYKGETRLVSYSFAVSTAIHLAIAFGLALGVRRRLLDERVNAERREATALAEVAREFVPMCAYCHNVRNEQDEWTPLEAYVSQHTASAVVGVTCPICAAAPA